MSAPPPPFPPRRSGPSTTTIVIAAVLVVVLGVTGAGLAGWAAYSFLDDSSSGGQLADPPKPSATVEAPTYPSELAKYYEQKLDWQSCDGNQCTKLTVPLDYTKPDGKSIKLAVLRSPATERSKRVGQLVVNPGGPGGSGVDYAAGGSSTFGGPLTRYFDIVGFDPRGIGKSTPLECAGTKQTDELLAADPDPDDAAEEDRLLRLTADYGKSCLENSGDLVKHMSTVEVAKDMDVLRAALGERQLDYLGASYGTFIGATYAELFPTHIRRMVLDGAIDPSLSTEQLSLGQARGFETALRAYVQDCVDRGGCVLGDSVEAGTARIKALLEELDAKPVRAPNGRLVTEGLANFGIIVPLYVKTYWPLLTAALTQAFQGNMSTLLQLSDQYTSRGQNGYTDNSMAALYAVNCLDHDDGVPADEIESKIPEFEKASPTFGRIFAYGLSSCDSWPVHTGSRPKAMAAEGAPPIVVVGTTRDPATPYRQAVALAEQLDSGVLVSRDGDGHTGFQQGNACVDKALENYLIGGTVPKDGLSC